MLPAIILFVVLASLVVVGYILNAKTPKPEGCENLNAACGDCHITSCINNPKLKEEIKND
ncbi:MAG: hypothetical protein Q4F12_00740 [Erysipelotrichaceae bacterium]|nr:hypothetical protein [Erysipelotrichaceae bacterium]